MVEDSAGRRRSDTRSATGKRIKLSKRDLLWLKMLHRHGPLPTSYLLAFSQALRASEKRQKERLGDLFHETNTPHGSAYLDRPAQQFATLKAGYNQIVHQISKSGLRALEEAGPLEISGQSSGPWVHRHMVACITASIELATLNDPGLSFIPGSAILERANTELRHQVTIPAPKDTKTLGKDLVPDAVFGLTYHTPDGDRFRFFVVEADRATEPVTSGNWNRKSFSRHLDQYDAYIAKAAYKDHLKLTSPLLVLNVVPDKERIDLMSQQVEQQLGPCSYQLFQVFPAFSAPWKPPEPHTALLTKTWARFGMPAFQIDAP